MLRLIFKAALAILFVLPSSAAFSSEEPVYSMRAASVYTNVPVKVIKKIAIPRWYHEGLFYDGKNIWIANGKKGKIWVVDTADGSVVSEITPISDFTEAVARISEDRYFVTEWDDRKIYRTRIEDGRMIAEAGLSLAPAHPSGVVWTGERLFVITWTRGMGTRFDLLEMDKGLKILRKVRILRIQEPAHMAWDGKNLWITSWYNRRAYKVDVEKMEVCGSFVSPVSLTTGIAWDGRYMWLTGTYSDLYQLELLQ